MKYQVTSMMIIIETTGAAASVALTRDDGSIYEKTSTERMNHLKGLVEMIDGLLVEQGLTISDMDCICASEGPGSFTGIRIGVSTVRAIAQALDKPVMGIPTLETFVYNMPEYTGIVCPIFDARRSQVYGGAFQISKASQGQHRPKTLIKGDAWELEDLLFRLDCLVESGDMPCENEQKILFFGDGVHVYKEQIDKWAENRKDFAYEIGYAPEELMLQRASSGAALARVLREAGEEKHYSELVPVYMRKSEAERKLEEGKK